MSKTERLTMRQWERIGAKQRSHRTFDPKIDKTCCVCKQKPANYYYLGFAVCRECDDGYLEHYLGT